MPAIVNDGIRQRTETRVTGKKCICYEAWYWEHHADGRRFRRRKVFATKGAAETFLRDVRLAAHDGTLCHKPKDVPTLAAFIERYERDGLADKRPNTRARNLQSLRFFVEHMGRGGRIRLDEITTADIEAFQAARLRAGRKERTVARDIMSICAALEVAVRWEIIAKNPGRKVPKLRLPERGVVFLEPEEQRRLIEAAHTLPKIILCKAPCLPHLIQFALNTGLRKGELFHLRWRDVDFTARRISVRNSEGFRTKSGRERIVGLNKPAAQALHDWRAWFEAEREVAQRLIAGGTPSGMERGQARLALLTRCWPAPDQLVFPSFKATDADGRPAAQDNMRKSLDEAAKASGIAREVTMHVFRHTFAVGLARAGVPLYKISKLLGHADTRVTEQHYLRFAKDEAPHAVDCLVEKAEG